MVCNKNVNGTKILTQNRLRRGVTQVDHGLTSVLTSSVESRDEGRLASEKPFSGSSAVSCMTPGLALDGC